MSIMHSSPGSKLPSGRTPVRTLQGGDALSVLQDSKRPTSKKINPSPYREILSKEVVHLIGVSNC